MPDRTRKSIVEDFEEASRYTSAEKPTKQNKLLLEVLLDIRDELKNLQASVTQKWGPKL